MSAEALTDRELLLLACRDIEYIKGKLEEITGFLKDCPAHRTEAQQTKKDLDAHIGHHRANTALLVAIFGPLVGLFSAILGAYLTKVIFK